MAGSDERIPTRSWSPTFGTSSGGSDMSAILAGLPNPQSVLSPERGNYNNWWAAEERIDGPAFVQSGQVSNDDCAPGPEEGLGNALAFRNGGATTSHGPSYRGQEANHRTVQEEVRFDSEPSGHMQGKRPVAHADCEPALSNKKSRHRDPNWTDGEKNLLLFEKLKWDSNRLQQVLGVDQNTVAESNKSWSHHAAPKLGGRENIKIQRQWDSILKSHKTLSNQEKKSGQDKSGHASFMETAERQKDTANFTRVFSKDQQYELVEFILQIEEGVKKIPLWKKSMQRCSREVGTDLPLSSTPIESGTTYQGISSRGQSRGPLDASRSQPSSSQLQDSTIPDEAKINDNFINTEGSEGAEDNDILKKVETLVNETLKDKLGHLQLDKLQGLWEYSQKHRDKAEALERILAVERVQRLHQQEHIEQLERMINPMGNASSFGVQRGVALNYIGTNRAHTRHVANYQRTSSEMNVHQLSNYTNTDALPYLQNQPSIYDAQFAGVVLNSNAMYLQGPPLNNDMPMPDNPQPPLPQPPLAADRNIEDYQDPDYWQGRT